MVDKAASKYLEIYAEPEAKLLDNKLLSAPNIGNKKFERTLLIPAYAESTAYIQRILEQWESQNQSQNLLVIIVLNCPDNIEADKYRSAQESLNQTTKLLSEVQFTNEHISWRSAPQSQIQFILVDRCTKNPIPHKQGVGLARKIGADIALKLHSIGIIESEWLHTTDADAHMPLEYFDISYAKCSALYYPHQYLEEKTLDNTAQIYSATQIYDARNTAYQRGLKAAKSPYCYNPTGSLLVVNFSCYAAARGFPKRAGGEDFYLLNKLQKLKGVQAIEHPVVKLECRTSDRVPFGTGPAVSKLIDTNTPELEAIFYNPKCFEVLKTGLAIIRITHPKSWSDCKDIPSEFANALEHIGSAAITSHLSKAFEKSQSEYQKHLDIWLDAFRTLKAMHFLRDNYFDNINYKEWQRLENNTE